MNKITLYKVKKFMLNYYNYEYLKKLGFTIQNSNELIIWDNKNDKRMYSNINPKYISCEDEDTLIEFNIKKNKINKLRIYDKSNCNYKLVYEKK